MRIFKAIAAAALLAIAARESAAQTSLCLPADSNSTSLISFVSYILTSTDAGTPAQKTELGLSNVSPSQVSLVTSGTDCTKASQAVDTRAGTPNSGRRVYVVKAGAKRFFVLDPNAKAGEYRPALVFDNKWVFIDAVLGF